LPEAAELYRELVRPAAGLLVGCEHICIIPDAFLCDVPFHALFNEQIGRYLIEDHSLSYAPSLSALVEIRRLAEQRRSREGFGADGNRKILVMGNPTREAPAGKEGPLLGRFQAIPGTEKQARAIAELFGDSSALYLGSDATEERTRALAGRFPFLHFATHGLYEPKHPMSSGLFLARGGPNSEYDGYWEAREILQTPLSAELVVLSACETARGRIHLGEGVWGLSWALFKAGAPASVLSQWAVADASTAELMTEFYRQLTQSAGEVPKVSKAEALRRAQLVLISSREHAHPFHWAPFILVGDWR
jgi:CHAT domain-containing protein